MAQNSNHSVNAPPKATVESIEAEIARTRERLSLTLTLVNDDVRALLNPNAPVAIPAAGRRDAADRVAAGLRTAGQISTLARPRKFGPLGVVTAVTGLTVFLFRVGIVRRS